MRSESDGHCYPRSFPGLAPREAVRRGELMPLVQTAATATDRPWTSSCATSRSSVDEAAGTRASSPIGSSGSARSTGASRSRPATAVRPGRPDTSCSPWVIPGSRVPGELAGDPRVVHAYEPHRLRTTRRDRRRGDGRGDGMAERARRGRRGRLGAAARPAAPAAQPPPPAVLQARARAIPRDLAEPSVRSSSRSSRRRRTRPATVGRAARRGVGRGALPGHGFRRRRGAGHLRDGFRHGTSTTRAASPRRGARARDTGSLARPRARLDGRGAERRDTHAGGRGRPRPVGVSRRRHARRDEVRSPPPPPQDHGCRTP